MDWRETVTSMSERVFPGINNKTSEHFAGNKVMSNLPLQMALYFNVIFLPVWILTMIVFLNQKYTCYDELHKFIIVTIIVSILIVESLRLYLGYEGNLRDKIPELAGFWMLSFLLQLPLQGILLFYPYFHLHIMEIVTQGIIFLMLLTQIIFGYFALKYTAAQQALYFRILRTTNKPYDNNQQKYCRD